MKINTASIRELRIAFRRVKQKIEQHGEIVITDHGKPVYLLKLLPRKPAKSAPVPDYYGRLLKRQPQPMAAEETRRFWDEERGER